MGLFKPYLIIECAGSGRDLVLSQKGMIMKLEERLNELEIKYSFQENTIKELNEVIATQQKELDAFKPLVQKIVDQLGDDVEDLTNPKPPHH